MWNDIKTSGYEGMLAETVSYPGHDGKSIRSYVSRPLGTDPCPSLVLIPHMPGWDEWCREMARRFTQHGYSVLCPNIYERFGHGTPAEVSKRAIEAGGVTDGSTMGDCQASLDFLRAQSASNGSTSASSGRSTPLWRRTTAWTRRSTARS